MVDSNPVLFMSDKNYITSRELVGTDSGDAL